MKILFLTLAWFSAILGATASGSFIAMAGLFLVRNGFEWVFLAFLPILGISLCLLLIGFRYTRKPDVKHARGIAAIVWAAIVIILNSMTVALNDGNSIVSSGVWIGSIIFGFIIYKMMMVGFCRSFERGKGEQNKSAQAIP